MLKSEEQYCVLIEIGGSHDECLLSQMAAISSKKIKIVLITTENIVKRNAEFSEYCDEIISVNSELDKRSLLKELKSHYALVRKAFPNHKVVLNTAQGWVIKRFCLNNLFSSIEFVGLFHDGLKYKNSFGQKLIRLKVKKSIFLSQFLVEYCGKKENRTSYYPIFHKQSLENIDHEGLNIAIIGGVETIKKDLKGFQKKLISIAPSNVRFYFLGQSEEKWPEVGEFKAFLKENRLEERVVLFDNYLSKDVFEEYLSQMDAILPLIHPGTQSGEIYFKTKISGSMNVALGYKLPILLHESLKSIKELHAAAVYYDFKNFEAVISNKELFQSIKQQMNQEILYSAQKQNELYTQFIFGY